MAHTAMYLAPEAQESASAKSTGTEARALQRKPQPDGVPAGVRGVGRHCGAEAADTVQLMLGHVGRHCSNSSQLGPRRPGRG
jgi:hypothetical protein